MPISASFHDLRDRVAASVDDRFAEPVRLSFMRGGVLDPDRSPVVVNAPLRTGGAKNTGAGVGGATWRTRIASGKAELHIDRATYTGPTPKKGDAVRALARAGEPAFEVLYVDDRSHTRLVLELGEK